MGVKEELEIITWENQYYLRDATETWWDESWLQYRTQAILLVLKGGGVAT